MGENDKNMAKLRIGGKSLTRAEQDSKGGVKFRDEQSGSYADATQFTKSEGRVAALADDIRGGMGYAGGTTNRAASMASQGSATLSKNLGQNAADVQKGMEDLEKIDADAAKKSQQELAKLTKMMARAQSGEKDAKGNRTTEDEVRIQAARVEQTFEKNFEKLGEGKGANMNEMLGISQVRDDLSSERGFTTAMKNFGAVDSGKDGKPMGFGAGMKQAFTAERLFGKDSKLTGMASGIGEMFGGESVDSKVASAKAKQEIAVEDQQAGVSGALGEEGLSILKDISNPDATNEEEIEKATEETAEISQKHLEAGEALLEAATDGDSLSVHEHHVEAKVYALLGGTGPAKSCKTGHWQ